MSSKAQAEAISPGMSVLWRDEVGELRDGTVIELLGDPPNRAMVDWHFHPLACGIRWLDDLAVAPSTGGTAEGAPIRVGVTAPTSIIHAKGDL